MDFKRNLDASALAAGAELVVHEVEPELGGTKMGEGTVFVGPSSLTWAASIAASKHGVVGFEVCYPDLHMHATSKDGSMHTQPCVFCMLAYDSDVPEWWPSPAAGSSSSLILPVASSDDADSLFAAISKCSALHPDSDDDDSGSGMAGAAGAGEWITADSLQASHSACGGGGAEAGDEGVQLASPEEYDEEALAAWEAKFIPPPTGVQAAQGGASGQFDD